MPKRDTYNLTTCIIDAIQGKKGTGISVLDLSAIEGASAPTFIICSGKTPTQVSAIADSIEETVKEKAKERPVNIHGNRNAQWIIIDYGYVMVHVFVPDIREYYNLEGLWSDADITRIADID